MDLNVKYATFSGSSVGKESACSAGKARSLYIADENVK